MLEIKTMSFVDAEQHVLNNQDDPFAIISITLEEINFNESGKIPHLIIQRDDLDETFSPITIKNCGGLFTKADGLRVKEFVEKHLSSVEYFLIHCDGGISRSTGIAAALSHVYTENEDWYFKNSFPNPVVYKQVLSAYDIQKDPPKVHPPFCFWCEGFVIEKTLTIRDGKPIHQECALAYDHRKEELE